MGVLMMRALLLWVYTLGPLIVENFHISTPEMQNLSFRVGIEKKLNLILVFLCSSLLASTVHV